MLPPGIAAQAARCWARLFGFCRAVLLLGFGERRAKIDVGGRALGHRMAFHMQQPGPQPADRAADMAPLYSDFGPIALDEPVAARVIGFDKRLGMVMNLRLWAVLAALATGALSVGGLPVEAQDLKACRSTFAWCTTASCDLDPGK